MITKEKANPFIGFYLNWQCSNCGVKYGNEPEICYACGATKCFVRITPEYQSMVHRTED